MLTEQRRLGMNQRHRILELFLVERIGVLDPEVGLRLHQVQRGIRDVDGRVVGGHLAAVLRRVVEDDVGS